MTYRLYPNVIQLKGLDALLESQRQLYNAALDERRGAWRWERRNVRWIDQFKELTGPEARQMIPSIEVFGVLPHRGTLKRVDDSFAQFFRGGSPRPESRFPSVSVEG